MCGSGQGSSSLTDVCHVSSIFTVKPDVSICSSTFFSNGNRRCFTFNRNEIYASSTKSRGEDIIFFFFLLSGPGQKTRLSLRTICASCSSSHSKSCPSSFGKLGLLRHTSYSASPSFLIRPFGDALIYVYRPIVIMLLHLLLLGTVASWFDMQSSWP